MKHTKLMLGMLLLTSLTVVSQEPQVADHQADDAALRVRPFFRDLFVNHMLQVEGTTELNGQTYINGNLVVNGTETINGSLVVNGPVTFTSETIVGDLNVTGCINAACQTITDNLCVGVNCNGFIGATGEGYLASLIVGGYAGETGYVQINGNEQVNGNLNVEGCITSTCIYAITAYGYIVASTPGTVGIDDAVPLDTNFLVNNVSSDELNAVQITVPGVYEISWVVTTSTAGQNLFQLNLNNATLGGTAYGISTVGGANQIMGQRIVNITDADIAAGQVLEYTGAALQLYNRSGQLVTLVAIPNDGTGEDGWSASMNVVRIAPLPLP